MCSCRFALFLVILYNFVFSFLLFLNFYMTEISNLTSLYKSFNHISHFLILKFIMWLELCLVYQGYLIEINKGFGFLCLFYSVFIWKLPRKKSSTRLRFFIFRGRKDQKWLARVITKWCWKIIREMNFSQSVEKYYFVFKSSPFCSSSNGQEWM